MIMPLLALEEDQKQPSATLQIAAERAAAEEQQRAQGGTDVQQGIGAGNMPPVFQSEEGEDAWIQAEVLKLEAEKKRVHDRARLL